MIRQVCPALLLLVVVTCCLSAMAQSCQEEDLEDCPGPGQSFLRMLKKPVSSKRQPGQQHILEYLDFLSTQATAMDPRFPSASQQIEGGRIVQKQRASKKGSTMPASQAKMEDGSQPVPVRPTRQQLQQNRLRVISRLRAGKVGTSLPRKPVLRTASGLHQKSRQMQAATPMMKRVRLQTTKKPFSLQNTKLKNKKNLRFFSPSQKIESVRMNKKQLASKIGSTMSASRNRIKDGRTQPVPIQPTRQQLQAKRLRVLDRVQTSLPRTPTIETASGQHQKSRQMQAAITMMKRVRLQTAKKPFSLQNTKLKDKKNLRFFSPSQKIERVRMNKKQLASKIGSTMSASRIRIKDGRIQPVPIQPTRQLQAKRLRVPDRVQTSLPRTPTIETASGQHQRSRQMQAAITMTKRVRLQTTKEPFSLQNTKIKDNKNLQFLSPSQKIERVRMNKKQLASKIGSTMSASQIRVKDGRTQPIPIQSTHQQLQAKRLRVPDRVQTSLPRKPDVETAKRLQLQQKSQQLRAAVTMVKRVSLQNSKEPFSLKNTKPKNQRDVRFLSLSQQIGRERMNQKQLANKIGSTMSASQIRIKGGRIQPVSMHPTHQQLQENRFRATSQLKADRVQTSLPRVPGIEAASRLHQKSRQMRAASTMVKRVNLQTSNEAVSLQKRKLKKQVFPQKQVAKRIKINELYKQLSQTLGRKQAEERASIYVQSLHKEALRMSRDSRKGRPYSNTFKPSLHKLNYQQSMMAKAGTVRRPVHIHKHLQAGRMHSNLVRNKPTALDSQAYRELQEAFRHLQSTDKWSNNLGIQRFGDSERISTASNKQCSNSFQQAQGMMAGGQAYRRAFNKPLMDARVKAKMSMMN